MTDITLSASIRANLLSLSETTDLIDQTNLRLASGLEVSSPVDDPIAFFAAEALSDRAAEFTERFDEIEQGVSAVSAALDGIEGVDSLTRQLVGLVSGLRSSSGQQFLDLTEQFNEIRTQIGELANDTEFSGLNLIDNTSEELIVNFSDTTTAFLLIEAVNLTETGLGIDELFTTADLAAVGAGGTAGFLTGTDSALTFAAVDEQILSFGGTAAGATGFTTTIVVTFNGTGTTIFEADTGLGTDDTEITFSFGTASVAITANTQQDVTVTSGQVLTLSVASAADSTVVDTELPDDALFGVIPTALVTLAGALTPTPEVTISVEELTLDDVAEGGGFVSSGFDFVQVGNSGLLDDVDFGLDLALDELAAEAATLGSNVAILQARLDFTEDYVVTLEGAAADLTLADLNTEGANLIALQTRQQLGINALSFAGQIESSILSLFP